MFSETASLQGQKGEDRETADKYGVVSRWIQWFKRCSEILLNIMHLLFQLEKQGLLFYKVKPFLFTFTNV